MVTVSMCRKKMKGGGEFTDDEILQIRSLLYHIAQLELNEFYFKCN